MQSERESERGRERAAKARHGEGERDRESSRAREREREGAPAIPAHTPHCPYRAPLSGGVLLAFVSFVFPLLLSRSLALAERGRWRTVLACHWGAKLGQLVAMADPLDDRPPTLGCEECLRELPADHFPSSVLASWTHHLAFPEHERRSRWSCKQCRAQQVVERERIQGFQNFRHIPDE